MSAAGWQVSDSAAHPSEGGGGGGWEVSDSPTPKLSAPASTPDLTGKPGEGTYPMWNDSGHKLPIPYSSVLKAQATGYKFDTNPIPERGITPQDAYRKDVTRDQKRVTTAPEKSTSPIDLTGKPGEGAYPMWDDAGHKLTIPYSSVPQAQKLGYQFDTNKIPERGLTPQEAYQKDNTQDPSTPPTGFSETARRGMVDLGKGALDMVNQKPPKTFSEFAKNAVYGPLKPLIQPVVEGAIDQLKQAGENIENFNATPWNQSDPGELSLAAGHGLAAAIPGLGPMAAQAGEQMGEHAARGDYGGAAGSVVPLAATMAAGELAPKIVKGVKNIPEGLKAVAQDTADEAVEQFRRNRPVDGENYTQGQHKAMATVLAEGNGGPGYIAPQVARSVTSLYRQTAADNPSILDKMLNGTPEEALAGHQAIQDLTKKSIDTQHYNALQSVADRPVDMTPVQDSITPSPAKAAIMSDDELADIQSLKDDASKAKTLEQENEFRKKLSTIDSDLQNGLDSKVARSSEYKQAVHKMYSAVRDHYYDSLQDATGKDFQTLKRQESEVIKTQDAMERVSPRLVNAETKATADTTLRQGAADVLEGSARGVKGGLPGVGWAADKLRGTKLSGIQQQLRRAYSDLPDPTPAPAAPPPQFSAARRQLANPQRQLPADVPANAEVGPAGQPQTPATPPQGSPGYNVSPEGTVRSGAPAPAMPSIITREPAAVLQLRAQAGPDGQGVPPPSPPTAPPLNEATSRMRVEPLPANPQPTPPTPAGFTVSPEGVAQRAPAGQLPASTGAGDVETFKGDSPGSVGVRNKYGEVLSLEKVNNPKENGVLSSNIAKDQRGKHIASQQLYPKLIEELAKQGKTLRSGSLKGGVLTPEAENVWKSLVRRGMATYDADSGIYRSKISAPIKSSVTNQFLKIGDEISSGVRRGTVDGFNPKTGKVVIKWRQ